MKASSICNLAAVLVVLSTGCNRDGVKVYHVSDAETASQLPPTAATTAMTAAMPDGLPAPDNSGLPSLQYILPAGWEKKAPTAMRVASFEISQAAKQADVSVIPMGGMAGGNLANVNRWRNQVGLEPIEEDAVQKMTEKIAIAGQDADLFDIVGAASGGSDAQRIIASVLHRDDTAWFFKITGDSALVEAQKPAFIAFLKSISFGAPAAAAPATDMSQLPPSHTPIDGMSLGGQNSLVPNANTMVTNGMISDRGGKSIWTIPADWKQTDPGPMLFAKFSIAAGDGKAEVNILSASGGGSLLANVTRWRGQVGLPPVTQEDELSKMVGSINGAATDKLWILRERIPRPANPPGLSARSCPKTARRGSTNSWATRTS